MIKVKQKYAQKLLVADAGLTVLLQFEYYCMEVDDGALDQGYYALMKVMNKSDDEDENEYRVNGMGGSPLCIYMFMQPGLTISKVSQNRYIKTHLGGGFLNQGLPKYM